ncbi:MAG: TIGR03663 family protein [Chloroflexales bacterium]|nr:TIGR03663 family protein [Chloroflexales bacterium]
MSNLETTFDQSTAVDKPRISYEAVALVLIFIASILLHLTRLGDMAMHHDESIHAWITWRFFTGAGPFTCAGARSSDLYCYDPVYHGPSLYILTFISYFLFGDGEWQARLPQALAGIGLTASVLWLRPYLGRNGTLVAAAAVALSPVILYFTRFARHDGLMILWEFWIVVGMFRYIDSRKSVWLWLMAAGIGLATTTHELYYIIGFLFFWFIALRVASEKLSQRILSIVLLAFVGFSLLIEAFILSGLWNGQLTTSLNASGIAVVMFFIAGISLAIIQLWPSTPIITPIAKHLWFEARNDLYIALGIAIGIFVLFYSVFFTDPRGILDGLYKGLSYWLGSQQSVARGDQPWYYYLMLMGLNEPLALFGAISIVIAAMVAAVKRFQASRTGTNTIPELSFFLTFVIYWFMGLLVFLSWAGEKMPWLTIHITVPAFVLVVIGVMQIIAKLNQPVGRNIWLAPGATILALAAFGVGIAQLSGANNTAQSVFPLLVAAGLLYGLFYLASKSSYAEIGRLVLLTVVVLLAAYTVRASWLINFEAPDTARDPMVYTQTSPDVPRIVKLVRDLAINQTRNQRTTGDVAGGLSMPIIMDVGGSDGASLAWPFQWYFRDMKRLEDRDDKFFTDATPDSFNVQNNDDSAQELAPVVLVSKDHVNDAAQTALEANYVKLMDGQLNWWFPEGDKCDPTANGYKAYYYSSLSARKAAEACTALDTKQLPSLLAPILWPLDRSHWTTTWRYLMYRQLPDNLTIGGRSMQTWVRKDLAGGSGVSNTNTTTSATYKIVADHTISLNNLGNVRGIAVGKDGTVVVADTENHQIVIYGADGSERKRVGSKGNGQNQFNEPRGVAIGPDGSIYVADTWNARIVKLAPTGEWVTTWGTGDQDFGEGRTAAMTDGSIDGNAANPLGFFGPRGIAAGADGHIYLADTGNKRIVVTDDKGTFLYQWGSYGAAEGQFNEPIGVAVDGDGTVAVGDTWNGRVQYFAPDGNGQTNPTPIATWRINGWQAQTYDDPYIAIQGGKIAAAIPKKNAITISGANGQETIRWGGSGNDNASFTNPSGVAFGPDGNIYVVDRDNHRVMVFKLP